MGIPSLMTATHNDSEGLDHHNGDIGGDGKDDGGGDTGADDAKRNANCPL